MRYRIHIEAYDGEAWHTKPLKPTVSRYYYADTDDWEEVIHNAMEEIAIHAFTSDEIRGGTQSSEEDIPDSSGSF